MSYKTQSNWREIQAFLPKEFQLVAAHEPSEEWWQWRGHHIHLDCFRNPRAEVKVILFHGVGTNGRQMSTILGSPLFRRGFEAIAIDMPEYGMTRVAPGVVVTYDDWVQAGSDLIDAELEKDGRPIVLYGLSAGGMLAWHTAALNRKVKGIVGMTFLDQQEQQVRDETALNFLMSRLGVPLTHLAAKTPLATLRMPMSVASKMTALVNNKAALKACLKDKTSAGKWVTMKFLSSLTAYNPIVAPEAFDVCPILLCQPEKDTWTPLHLSEIFLKRVNRVPKKVVMLENAGHYPLEQPGLTQLCDAVAEFTNSCSLT
jgi:alpha-beta hydrolase superfamily lysophospholipase